MMKLVAGLLVVATVFVQGGSIATAALSGTPAGATTRSATFSVGPGRTHALNESFTVDVLLSDVVFGDAANWAGYDFELDYDHAVLVATSVSSGLCPAADRIVPSVTPVIRTGCGFQASTTTAGRLETITFVCVGPGTSPLHLPALGYGYGAGNELFDGLGGTFPTVLNDGSAVCDGALPAATNTPTSTATSTPSVSPTATSTPSGAPDSATLAVNAPAEAQPLYTPLVVAVDLTTFTPGVHPYWAGYDFELSYDPTVLQVSYIAPGLCPRNHWGNPSWPPHIVTGCFALQSTATGTLENVVVQCLREGTSVLHIVPHGDPSALAAGTELFDFSGSFYFALSPQDSTVTCASHIDDDGDGCSNTAEAALGLNPLNPWDFYSVPSPALIGAADPHLSLKSNLVAADGAQAVFAYFKAGAKAGTAVYDQDLNGNGIKDGIEYDRSVAGSAMSGPPSGVIGATQAQLAFAQFKLGYHC